MIAPTIRPAIEDDRDQLVRIMLDAFKASYATFMPREYVESWHRDNTARAAVDKGLDRTGVAEIDGRVQGFATTEDDVLDELWVSPAARAAAAAKPSWNGPGNNCSHPGTGPCASTATATTNPPSPSTTGWSFASSRPTPQNRWRAARFRSAS